jgi:hypothetical protein
LPRDRVINNYTYRLDHDTGFAPHVMDGVCTLCGCKTTTIEVWAQPGSWVVGIGGNNTGKPNLLIYAMKVECNPTVGDLCRRSPGLTGYLRGHGIAESARILMSKRFYYFGDNAISLPSELQQDLIIPRQGCKKVTDKDIARLVAHLEGHSSIGKHGDPNNPTWQTPTQCGCSRGASKPRSSASCT